MSMRFSFLTFVGISTSLSPLSNAATLSALSTFGSGTGVLAPASYSGSATGNSERMIAYNPATGNLALVSRNVANRVDILNGATGAFLKTMTAPAGGYASATLNISGVAVSTDGQIFTANLADGSSATAGPRNLTVYAWPSESDVAAPNSAVYTLPTGLRLGDSMDATGSGSSALISMGYNDTAAATATAGDDGFAVIPANLGPMLTLDPTAGSAASAFRLNSSFVDSSTVLANNNGVFRLATFTGGTVDSVTTLTGISAAERHGDIINVGGTQYLATLSSGTTDRNLVKVYSLSGSTATLLSSLNLIETGAANANATGDIEWGAVNGDSINLYALTTNNGLQGMRFEIPEPNSAVLSLVAGMAICLRRRNRV